MYHSSQLLICFLCKEITVKSSHGLYSIVGSSSTIQLFIFNDTSPEINETFTVQLSNPTGGGRLGDQSEIIITIL